MKNKENKSIIKVYDNKTYNSPDYCTSQKSIKGSISQLDFHHINNENNKLSFKLNLGEKLPIRRPKQRGIALSMFLKQFKPEKENEFIMPEVKQKFTSMIFKTNLPEKDQKDNITVVNYTEPNITIEKLDKKLIGDKLTKIKIRLRTASKIPTKNIYDKHVKLQNTEHNTKYIMINSYNQKK